MWSPWPGALRAPRGRGDRHGRRTCPPATRWCARRPGTGRCAPSPRPTRPPDSACTMNSVVGRSAYGPVRPYGVIEHTTSPGARRATAARRTSDGTKLSMTTSAAGDERLDLGVARHDRPPSACRGAGTGTARRRCRDRPVAPPADHARHGSPPGGSTFTTSAPASASSRLQYPPGMPVLRSTTRSAARPCCTGQAGSEVRQREAAFHLVELDLDAHADLHRVVLAPDEVGEDLPALVHVDDDRHVGHLERRASADATPSSSCRPRPCPRSAPR